MNVSAGKNAEYGLDPLCTMFMDSIFSSVLPPGMVLFC